jgi:hypothetical protein
MFLRVIGLAPHLAIDARVEAAGDDLSRVDLFVANHGYLPTYVLASAKKLPWNEPLVAEVIAAEGCTLVDPHAARREVGHLDGWGRGKFGDGSALFWQRSRGSTGSRTIRWIVRGRGHVTIRVGACRTGWIERRIEI